MCAESLPTSTAMGNIESMLNQNNKLKFKDIEKINWKANQDILCEWEEEMLDTRIKHAEFMEENIVKLKERLCASQFCGTKKFDTKLVWFRLDNNEQFPLVISRDTDFDYLTHVVLPDILMSSVVHCRGCIRCVMIQNRRHISNKTKFFSEDNFYDRIYDGDTLSTSPVYKNICCQFFC